LSSAVPAADNTYVFLLSIAPSLSAAVGLFELSQTFQCQLTQPSGVSSDTGGHVLMEPRKLVSVDWRCDNFGLLLLLRRYLWHLVILSEIFVIEPESSIHKISEMSTRKFDYVTKS